VRQTNQSLFAGGIYGVNSEETHDLENVALVDEAQGVKLVDAGVNFPFSTSVSQPWEM